MKKLLLLIVVPLLSSCETIHFNLLPLQTDEFLVMQIVVVETDYESNDVSEILTNHKELYRFPSSILRLNKYPDIDVIAEDAEYRMKVLRFKENDEGVSLAIALLRRYRLRDVSYGMPRSENEEIRSIYQKQSVQTENVYTKDRWHILGQDYRKRTGDKKGEGVYFLLRINSRREIDGNAPSLLMLKEEFL